jgi:RNA polymerase sigma-70 factor (ECF subfamily)
MLRLADPSTLPEPDVADDRVWRAVGKLPGKQRAAIALHYLEDRSIEEIAEILEVSPATARVHLHRGRQALARTLGPEEVSA